jgi:hypothetical protein
MKVLAPHTNLGLGPAAHSCNGKKRGGIIALSKTTVQKIKSGLIAVEGSEELSIETGLLEISLGQGQGGHKKGYYAEIL